MSNDFLGLIIRLILAFYSKVIFLTYNSELKFTTKFTPCYLLFQELYILSTFKGGCNWISKFTNRFGISLQAKTNKKSKSIEERLPQVRNFHWWAVYQMALEEPWWVIEFSLKFGKLKIPTIRPHPWFLKISRLSRGLINGSYLYS